MNATDQTILNYLTIGHIMSRKTLAKLSGIPRTTVYEALIRLQLKGKVFRLKSKKKRKIGRKRVYWTIKTERE